MPCKVAEQNTMLRHLLACTCVAALWLPAPLRRNPQQRQKPKVAVLGGGFAGLTAARRLKNNRAIGEVILLEQKHYFEYTPGILRAWVDAHEHRRLVKPLAKLFRGRRATFALRVGVKCLCCDAWATPLIDAQPTKQAKPGSSASSQTSRALRT